MTNILVFGQSGQVATELQHCTKVVALGRSQADLTDPQACADAIKFYSPDVVINAAAYTAVDQAEDEEAIATVINGDAPSVMARTCAGLDIPFVHISTDYVFSGEGDKPWKPHDSTAPLGAYGRSKLEGEAGIQAAGGNHAILRTSWVFSSHGNNFVKTMLRLAETRQDLTIVADQIGGPTEAKDIAEACLALAHGLLAGKEGGIYHFSGAPDVSWAEFAREIFSQANQAVTVEDIPTSSFPTKAARPSNSRMNCDKTKTDFNIERPDWRMSLARVLKELKDK